MAEYLVIRPLAGDLAEWLSVDETGARLAAPAHGTLSDAAEAATGRRVIGVMPARCVLRTNVSLPVKGQARIMQALPFALEDQLAEDVDNLHFAVGKLSVDGISPVAVVRRSDMDTWLQDLRTAGLEPVALYSEADGIDALPSTAVVLVEPEQVCLRDESGTLACGDTETLGVMLDLWLAGRDSDARPNLMAFVVADSERYATEVLDALRPQLETLDISLLADGSLPRLAARLVTTGGVNLLQGNYARRSDLARHWPAWRLAASLLVGVGAIALLSKGAQVWNLEQRATQLQNTVEQAFRYSFPDMREVSGDPRRVLESKLRELSRNSGSGNDEFFLDTLQAVAMALPKGGNARLESLDYRTGVMELRVRVPNVESLDRIQRAIVDGGRLKAEIQSANANDGGVLGRLRIRAAGA